MTLDQGNTGYPTADQLEAFVAELKVRRLSVTQFANYVTSHHGVALSPANRDALKRGNACALDRELFDTLWDILTSLPDAKRVGSKGSKLGHITITSAMRRALNGLFEKTGITPALLVRRRPPELQSLTVNKVSNWRTGRVVKADPVEWRYVVDALCGLRSGPRPPKT